MPKNTESLNRNLFELLHSKGLDPTMLDTSGKAIPTPEEAEVFQFNFVKDGEDYGTVTISIDGLHKLTIYFSDEVANSEKEESESDDVSWYKLLNQLKKFSQKYQLSFELRNVSNLKHDMAKREYMKKKESIAEGYYPMGRKASYSDAVPSVKIVLQHSRQIEEGEQRYRNVERIFLENEQGERFLAPTTRPGIARVYARHIAEGGKPHDDRWNHIGSLCEEYSKMAGFVRATRNGQFTESTQKLIAEGINHYQSLRESLGKLAGHRGYNTYFESWTPPLMEDDSDMSNINELFVQETVDPRIESVMPILSKLQKKISEMSEVNELSEWADKLIEGDEDIEDNEASDDIDNAESELTEEESLTSNNPQGVPEGVEELPQDALDLIDEYIAKIEPDADRDEMIQSLLRGTIHSSELEYALQDDLDEGILDTIKSGIKKVGGKILDKIGHGSDEDLLRDLKDKAGVRNPQTGKPSMAYSDVEKRTDEVDTGQYDARKSTPKGGTTPEQEKSFREKVRQYGDELEQRQKDKSQGVAEGYDTVTSIVGSSDWNMRGWKIRWGKINQYTGKYNKMYQGIINKDGIHPEKSRSGFPIFAFTPINTGDQEVENKEQGIDVPFFDYRVEVFDPNKNDWVQLNIKSKPADTSKDYNPKESVAEGEFAGDYATGEAGQWRNKGPKANKPATIGDLVGEGQEDLDTIKRLLRK
jgi:hypothetical protein